MGGENWGNPNRTKSYRSKAENQQTQRNKRWVGNQTQVSLLPWASSFVRDWHNIFKNVVLNTNESSPKICSWNLFSRLSAVAAVHRSGNGNLTLIYLFHIKSSFLSPRLGCEWYCEKNFFSKGKNLRVWRPRPKNKNILRHLSLWTYFLDSHVAVASLFPL